LPAEQLRRGRRPLSFRNVTERSKGYFCGHTSM